MKHLKIYFKVLLFVFVSIAFSVNCYSVIWLNGAGEGYESGDGGDSTSEEHVTIEDYIIKGAGYYLAANSDFQSLLNMVELQDTQGIETSHMLAPLDSAISNMGNAIDTFDRLIQKAEVTPYNSVVSAKLKNFSYSLCMQGNGLNSVVFGEVEEYLQKGDITGTFKVAFSRLQAIYENLKRVREALAMGIIPDIAIFWDINDDFSITSLFGSYVARVFNALQKNK